VQKRQLKNGRNLRKLTLNRHIFLGLTKFKLCAKTVFGLNMGGRGGEASTGSKIIIDVILS
jgi:hypothetical protein